MILWSYGTAFLQVSLLALWHKVKMIQKMFKSSFLLYSSKESAFHFQFQSINSCYFKIILHCKKKIRKKGIYRRTKRKGNWFKALINLLNRLEANVLADLKMSSCHDLRYIIATIIYQNNLQKKKSLCKQSPLFPSCLYFHKCFL